MSLALTDDGSLYSFGTNVEGSLGRDDDSQFGLVDISALESNETIIQIGHYSKTGYILTNHYNLYALGNCEYGICGTKDNVNFTKLTKINL